MQLTGLHLLLTYQCTYACDHCFVWGSPDQRGTMTLEAINEILRQAAEHGISWIFFEGGEPFLYYATLLYGVRAAAEAGFRVGVVTNAYWAKSGRDVLEWLRPLKGLLEDLSISDDGYHSRDVPSAEAQAAIEAAEDLGIPSGCIAIAPPETEDARQSRWVLASGGSALMLRGRAAHQLAGKVDRHPWEQFDRCPHEDLRYPGRVHVDPLGNLHLCQGLTMGNLFKERLDTLCAEYDPEAHPIAGPLLDGGPAELVRRYALPHEAAYGDACHLCDDARRKLRSRFPEILTPDQMYGVAGTA